MRYIISGNVKPRAPRSTAKLPVSSRKVSSASNESAGAILLAISLAFSLWATCSHEFAFEDFCEVVSAAAAAAAATWPQNVDSANLLARTA